MLCPAQPRSIGRSSVAELQCRMEHAVIADLKALVYASRVAGAIAFARLPDGGMQGSVVAVLEHDVDDAGNSVGAVLRRGAIAQDFDALDGADRNGVQVRAGGAAPDGSVDVDEGTAVPPFTVHQYQNLVRSQASQRGGSNRVRTVADCRAGKIEGGNQCLDDAADLRFTRFENLLLSNHVNRHGRVCHGSVLATGTNPDHHQFLQLNGLCGCFLGYLRPVLIGRNANGEQADQQHRQIAD